jgi:hypothetical protein
MQESVVLFSAAAGNLTSVTAAKVEGWTVPSY